MCARVVRLFNHWAGKIAQQHLSDVQAEEGERFIGDMSVLGSNTFRDEVTASIILLKDKYPFGYSLMQRYISAIVSFPRRIDFGIVSGLCFEVPRANSSLAWHPNRFAALLVRRAILARLSKQGFCVFRNRRVQSVAWKAELRCMKMLDCHPDYIKQQEDYIRLRSEK